MFDLIKIIFFNVVSPGWLAVLDVSCPSDGHGVPERAGEGPGEREREMPGEPWGLPALP